MKRLSVTLAGEEDLERLAAAPRPLGMRRGRSTYHLFRETYFDTADDALAEAGIRLSVAVEASGEQLLRLFQVKGVDLQGVVEEEGIEEPLVGEGVYAALRRDSPLAQRVASLVEPQALRPRLAVDVDREVVELRPRLLTRASHVAYFERMQAHAPGFSRDYQQVTLREDGEGGAGLEGLAAALAGQPGVLADGLDVRTRVLRTLKDSGTGDPSGHAVRLTLLAVHGNRIALWVATRGFVLPWCSGSGEEEARRLARTVAPGSAPGGEDVDLLGFAPDAGGADTEIWLVDALERPGLSTTPAVWLSIPEVLERVGAPGLRDPRLVAGLAFLVRSEIGRKVLAEASLPRTGPTALPLAPRPPVEPGEHDSDFLDPELSILDFNQRVLEMAEDPTVPLLERFRFLCIFSRNLDEFFAVRVGRLKTRAERGAAADEAALVPDHLLECIGVRTRALVARQYRCLEALLLPALAAAGARIRSWSELDEGERDGLTRIFRRDVFPLLTPRSLASSPGQAFPRLPSLHLSVAVRVEGTMGNAPRLAHVVLPERAPRFLRVGDGPDVVPLEEVVMANAAALFPSASVVAAHPFRITRAADVTIDSEDAGSLLNAVADEVEDRRFKPAIRLEVSSDMPREVRAHLLRELRGEAGTDGAVLSRGDIHEIHGLLDLGAMGELTALPVAGGLFPPFEGNRVVEETASIFERLDAGDLLVHHPYDTFDSSVGKFLREAAVDPEVVSIKLTVYRTGRDSPVVSALLDALSRGKDVTVFVELQARFDEENNIEWTHRLSAAGGHVVYGVPGYKTHAKTALVVRRSPDGGLTRYVHVGTGNYNAATAGLYTDLGLLSSQAGLGEELHDFFNELTGSLGPPAKPHDQILVAPTTLAPRLLELVDAEVEHARAGRPASVRAKLNGLSDREIIRALYRASGLGVNVDLVVRAICTLRPGVPGLSERIRVRSILGRFLEHSRIYRFENGGDPRFYIGSADWRKRNLRRRVEVVTPVTDARARARLERIMAVELADPTAWVLRPDGVYQRTGAPGRSAQQVFMEEARRNGGMPHAALDEA